MTRAAPPTTAAPGRVPPHSIEAEEQLLSACLLDGGDVVARCLESEIAAASFYVPANRVIYAKLLELYNSGKPIDLAVLAEELKKTRQLDEIGGYPYLTRISGRIPTTAGAGYFIEKVGELALLRGIIVKATEAVERCYGYTGKTDLDEIVAPLRAAGEVGSAMDERIRAAMISFDRPPPEPQPRWLIDHKPICTPGNLTAIVAQAKAGKTALIGSFLAAAMAAESARQGVELDGIDTLGVEAIAPADRIIIHFDTEQSPADFFKTLKRAVARAKLTEPPPWIWPIGCAGWSAADLRKALTLALKRARRRDLKVFGVILDGVADLCADVNDAEESNALVAELHAHAIANDCPIICVVHRNEGDKADSAARGHLGKQLARKAETNLRMEKRDGKTVVFSERNRGAPILEKDGPCFEWSDEKGYHVSSKSVGRSRLDAETDELKCRVVSLFQGKGELRWAEIHAALMADFGRSKNSAERDIKRMRQLGLIVPGPTSGKFTPSPQVTPTPPPSM